jgi:hypothetical protein
MCKVNFRSLLIPALTTALLGTAARADITIEERINMEGLLRLANMSGTTQTSISGQRARMESNLQMESRLMRAFASDGPTAEIVRLDDDKIYELQLKKKTYTESSFAEKRAELEKIVEQQKQAQAQQQQTSSGVDESQCEWLPPKVEVQRTGEQGSFAGFDAERVTISAVQSCKVKNTAQVCDFGFAMDQWLTPDFDGDSEALAYQRAYAEKIGTTLGTSRDVSQRLEAMAGRYEDMWRELASKLKDLKGYPVKSSFGMGVGGPQCQDAQARQQSGGSAAGGGGIAGQLGGALGGLFGKKKDKSAEAQPAPAPALVLPNGLTPLMVLTSELVSVSRAPIDPQAFEVPSDFKKAKQ